MEESKDKQTSESEELSVPRAVVSRLSLYLRELQKLLHDGHATTNSTQLGELLGFTDAQIRKDLAYFGQFGYPGIGYRCEELNQAIKKILGTDRTWPVAMIGLGNLGRALLRYRGFQQQGFRIVAAFDVDPDKIGKKVEGVEVFHHDDLTEVVAAKGIRMAIVAVPGSAAQAVSDSLVAAGIEGVLNFAQVRLALPDHVSCVGVDLAIELEQLAFAVVNHADNP